tara:strand:- start:3525 stop:4427 length:903 start_codon:yes stop_codon:yes gene_type:complete
MPTNDIMQGVGLTVSGSGKTQKVEVPYMVRGSQRSPELVRNSIAVHMKQNSVLWGMKIADIKVTEVFHGNEDGSGNISGVIWEGSVSLVSVKKRDPEEQQLGLKGRSFDTGGGSMSVQYGTLKESLAPQGQAKQNFEGAINVTVDDGKPTINGIDIQIPTLKFSEQWNLYAPNITASWVKNVSQMTGTVNRSGFRGFQPGEVLFMGASGSFTPLTAEEVEDGKIPIVSMSFNFDTSANLYKKKIGGESGVVISEKRGWDVLSIVHRLAVSEQDARRIRPVISQVDVIEVYEQSDFGWLLI